MDEAWDAVRPHATLACRVDREPGLQVPETKLQPPPALVDGKEFISWVLLRIQQDRGPGAGGPCYQWTRKVRGKTVSVALSKEQYAALKEAIENWRELETALDRMQKLTRQKIFGTMPDISRRKQLTKKVVGLI